MIKYSLLWHQVFLKRILISKVIATTVLSGPLHTQIMGVVFI